MNPGDISEAFVMKDAAKNKDIAAIVKLASRTPGHRANLSDDYNMIKDMYINHKKQEVLKEWLEKKSKIPTSGSKTAGITATSITRAG